MSHHEIYFLFSLSLKTHIRRNHPSRPLLFSSSSSEGEIILQSHYKIQTTPHHEIQSSSSDSNPTNLTTLPFVPLAVVAKEIVSQSHHKIYSSFSDLDSTKPPTMSPSTPHRSFTSQHLKKHKWGRNNLGVRKERIRRDYDHYIESRCGK